MSLPTCPHEPAVIRAAMSAAWPGGADEALVTHARTCAVCRDAVLVVTLMQEADDIDVPVPTAAQMWWRLAVRARLERERAAARPVVWLQGLAAACGLGLAASTAGMLQPGMAAVAVAGSGVASRAARLLPDVSWPAVAAHVPWTLAFVAGGLLVLTAGSAALYLWLADD